MRAGVCGAQQTLSAEAASVLKHSLSLARRRGHAQVTPLHVSATLLSARASPLRRACLKSQPHQSAHLLQCRALELCFNVALNRLPATPSPLLHAQPSLSNALIAALKRAQAHQRRGCVEQQQPPLLAIKVELEQLILSILDDPSCYNTSGGIYSTPNSPPPDRREAINPSSFSHSHLLPPYASDKQNPLFFSPHKITLSSSSPMAYSTSLKEDISLVFDVFLRKKRRNTVILGDSLAMIEGLVTELMSKVKTGVDLPEELKSAYFIKFQFSSVPLKFMKREEVEMNITDLKRKIESFAANGRIIIYTGDLKWAVDSGADHEREEGVSSAYPPVYSPVDHLVAEVGKLLSWYSNSATRVWLMATANYQTYMKCQMKQPPLDVQWALQPVSVPSGGLGLSLNAASAMDPAHKKPSLGKEEEQGILDCCQECTSNYQKEVGFKPNHSQEAHNGSAQLPYWLRPQGVESSEKEDLVQLRRKYTRHCQSAHRGTHNPNDSNSNITSQRVLGTSSYPCLRNSVLSDSETISFGYSSVKPSQSPTSLPRFRRQQSCHIEFNFSNGSTKNRSAEANLDSLKRIDDKEVKITLALGSSVLADSAVPEKIDSAADMCKTLLENVPWQSETIRLVLRSFIESNKVDTDQWLLFQGNDHVAKRRVATGIAKSLPGSSNSCFFSVNTRTTTSTPAQNIELLEKFLKDHEKAVVLVEDVDYADPEFAKFLADGFENEKFKNAVMILTRNSSTRFVETGECCLDSVIQMKIVVSQSRNGSGAVPVLDHKRKSEWDFPSRSKNQKSKDMEEVSSDASENGKKDSTAQLSSSKFDLNMTADEEGKAGEVSPISSDLTRETTTMDQQNPLRFLEKTKNCFVFNQDMDQGKQAKEMFSTMFEESFQEVFGGWNVASFSIDEAVLEEVLRHSGFYLNSLFRQWLDDVFRTSLRGIDTGEGGNVSVKLCLDGKGGNSSKDGFMGTCLPKGIHVCYVSYKMM